MAQTNPDTTGFEKTSPLPIPRGCKKKNVEVGGKNARVGNATLRLEKNVS